MRALWSHAEQISWPRQPAIMTQLDKVQKTRLAACKYNAGVMSTFHNVLPALSSCNRFLRSSSPLEGQRKLLLPSSFRVGRLTLWSPDILQVVLLSHQATAQPWTAVQP